MHFSREDHYSLFSFGVLINQASNHLGSSHCFRQALAREAADHGQGRAFAEELWRSFGLRGGFGRLGGAPASVWHVDGLARMVRDKADKAYAVDVGQETGRRW